MSSVPPSVAQAMDRSEVHRSSRSLEQIVGLFHDYCQAASASATIKKKLSRAMKEASQAKGTNPIAVNAFLAASTTFEILSEVETKFARVCEREYEGLSVDMKKWFKKMAASDLKEEKVHDEYAASIQNKLKSATQAFDKKSKGRFADSTVDHTRFVNQMNTLTNDLNQARMAHSAYISQKHTTMLFGSGAAMTRFCDAHWTLVCEEVRKVAAVIGDVGQWRAHCEGGWAGELPGDLINLTEQARLQEAKRLDRVSEEAEQSSSAPLNGADSTSSHAQRSDKSSDSQIPPSPRAAYTPGSAGGARPLPAAPGATSPIQSLALPAAGPPSSQRSISPTIPQPSSPAHFSPGGLSDVPSFSPPTLERPNDVPAFPFPTPSHGTGVPPTPLSRQRTPPGYTNGEAPGRALELPISRTEDRRRSGESNGPPMSYSGSDTSQDPQATERDTRARDAARVAPRMTFAPAGNATAERPRQVGRSTSIDSTGSLGSHVAAMRERYNERGVLLVSSPPLRDTLRFSSTVGSSSRGTPTDSAGTSSRSSIPPSSFATPTTERHYTTRRNSVEFGDGDRGAPDREVEASPSSSLRSRERYVNHTPRKSRDWAEERDIIEDRDQDGTRRRRMEDVELSEREMMIRTRERELEMMTRDLAREKDQFGKEQDYPGEQDRLPAGLQSPRDRDRQYERDREFGVVRRNDAPLSPTPRRTASPPPLSILPHPKADESALGHASNCGCYECSARHYATPLANDRDRYVGSTERFADSSTSLSTSSHANIARTPSGQPKGLGFSLPTPSSDTLGSLPTNPVKPEKRGVLAGLRRLSMPLGSALGGSDRTGAHSPTYPDSRAAASFGISGRR